MLIKAQKRHSINMQDSFLVGDKLSDIQAAEKANIGRYFLVKSGHPIPKIQYKENNIKRDLYHVANSL